MYGLVAPAVAVPPVLRSMRGHQPQQAEEGPPRAGDLVVTLLHQELHACPPLMSERPMPSLAGPRFRSAKSGA